MKNILIIFLILLGLLTLISTFGGSIRYTESFVLDPSEAMHMSQMDTMPQMEEPTLQVDVTNQTASDEPPVVDFESAPAAAPVPILEEEPAFVDEEVEVEGFDGNLLAPVM